MQSEGWISKLILERISQAASSESIFNHFYYNLKNEPIRKTYTKFPSKQTQIFVHGKTLEMLLLPTNRLRNLSHSLLFCSLWNRFDHQGCVNFSGRLHIRNILLWYHTSASSILHCRHLSFSLADWRPLINKRSLAKSSDPQCNFQPSAVHLDVDLVRLTLPFLQHQV